MRIDHKLKIKKEYFRAVVMGIKTFEIRETRDRDFKAGQFILLEEIDNSNHLTKEAALVKITYVTDYQQKEGYEVLGIELEFV